MARVDAKAMQDYFFRDSVECLFCKESATLKEGRMSRGDFIYWSQGGLLILCQRCATTYLPRLLADVSGDGDRILAEATATFWRARSKQANSPLPTIPEAT